MPNTARNAGNVGPDSYSIKLSSFLSKSPITAIGRDKRRPLAPDTKVPGPGLY